MKAAIRKHNKHLNYARFKKDFYYTGSSYTYKFKRQHIFMFPNEENKLYNFNFYNVTPLNDARAEAIPARPAASHSPPVKR